MMQPEAILNLIRRASLFDIFIVSFLLLPFIAKQWIDILADLEWSKPWGLAVMLAAYVIGIVLMLAGARRTARRETARDAILGYLSSKSFTMVSNERIRERINGAYDDAMLDSLPGHFPEVLRRAKLTGGKRGLARILSEEEPPEA